MQFPFLPAGCNMQLDEKTSDVILRSLREAIPSQWRARVDELRSLRNVRPDIDLAGFLDESGLDLDDLYANSRTWSELLDAAEAPIASVGPNETPLRRAIGRQLHVDDAERIAAYREFLSSHAAPPFDLLPERARRMLHMLVASITDQAITKEYSVQDAADLLWAHPQVISELSGLFEILNGRITHLHRPLMTHADAPLHIHARYSRIEILTAMGLGGDQAKIAS